MSKEIEFKVNDSSITEQALKCLGDKSMFIAMEEMSELQKEVSKMERGKGNEDHVAEEIADVIIVLTWIAQRYGISKAYIDGWLEYKSNRIIEQMNRGSLK